MATQDLENGTGYKNGTVPVKATTAGGHSLDNTQTPLPPQHRQFGNPAPLGLTSFGCGFFIASAFNLHTRGVVIPNVVVPVLILYGGLFQSLVGMWELALGNTFGGTVFGSFGAFNFTYGGLYLPAFGVIEAYTLADGTISPQFNQAVGIYLIAWMMVTMLFFVGALRTNVTIVSTLGFTVLAFLFLGLSNFTGSDPCRIAGGAFGMCATFCAWWGAMTGFWSSTATFGWIKLPAVALQ